MHFPETRMKLPILFIAIVLPAWAVGQDASPPAPQATPVQTSRPMDDLALPLQGEEPNGAPTLLPESAAIPDHKVPTLESLKKGRLTRQHDSSARRLEEAREIAVRSPHAAALLKRAKSASSSKTKRRYLRAYYMAVCGRMRKLEPNLKSEIDAYEVQKTAESIAPNATPSRKRSIVHRTRLYHRHVMRTHRYHHYGRVYGPPEYEDYPPPFFYGLPPGW
jgi:hypothetical protein